MPDVPLTGVTGVLTPGALRTRDVAEVPALGEIPGPIDPSLPVVLGPEPTGIVPF